MTNPEPSDAAEAGLRIAAALETAGIPHALGGALALGAHGVPRGTLDVDLNVFVTPDTYPVVLATLRGIGVEFDEAASIARAEREGIMVGRWAGMRVDVFVPSIPFSDEAGRTRVHLSDGTGGTVAFLSVEALTLFKLLFFRSKDLADIERLVSVRGTRFDRAYVRRWLIEMMGENDARVRAWDTIAGEPE
jgi:hypothetical protein